MERLEITVKEIRGKCPVYKLGDRIVIEGPEVKLDETDAICTHAFASLLPYIVALRKGIKPRELGLGRGGRRPTCSASTPPANPTLTGGP